MQLIIIKSKGYQMFMPMQGPRREGLDTPPECKQQQCNLYILALAHFGTAVALTVALPGVGFGEIFFAMILMCIAYSMNFCMVIFYMIMMMFDIVNYFSAVGMFAQNGDFIKCYHNQMRYDDGTLVEKCPFKLTMLIVFFVFSIISVLVSFYAYRIFKAQALGRLGGALI
jgi:hypothetical protein